MSQKSQLTMSPQNFKTLEKVINLNEIHNSNLNIKN